MGDDKYKVKILHYTNPHLIWTLVEKVNEINNVEFEQIGIYGISPLNVTIDYEGNVETTRCKEWLPAVFMAMKRILLEATEVWFSVSFVDRTTSVFDDNLHKYGDLTIKLRNGRTVSMLQELLATGFVEEDVQDFHHNLNTKLDYIATVGVMKKIKESYQQLDYPSKLLQTAFDRQITVFKKTVELEDISRRSLVGFDRNDHSQLVRKHINHLNACKDVDEESVGRACVKSTAGSVTSGGLMKNLSIIKTQSSFSKEKKSVQNHTDRVENESSGYHEKRIDDEDYKESQGSIVKNRNKKGNKPKEEHKKLIAFGPAGLNPTQYGLKEVTINTDTPQKTQSEKYETDCFNAKNDMFENTDSEVNLSLNEVMDNSKLTSKLKTLEKYYKKSNTKSLLNPKSNEKNLVQESTKTVKPTSLKIQFLKDLKKLNNSSSTEEADSTIKGDDSDSESITALVDKIDLSNSSIKKQIILEPEISLANGKINVNPFKNLDGSKSVFVDKLISPTLMVHTKNGNRIQPVSNMRDIPFGSSIHIVLRNMSVTKPMRPQTVSWPYILRGHSLFLVSPYNSGKTLGYLPSVCRLVSDSKKNAEGLSVARLTCIIVCATANSVAHVEELCKMFLHEARVFACYAGMTDISISTTLLNGCDILISTPSLLVRLMRDNLGLDLRNLNTFVIDDCERVSEVYQNEIKYCLHKVKDMLKGRANKNLKVQYVVVSRIWCNMMSILAKNSPNSVVCIGAFQECVLYSEADTSIAFLKKESKVDAILDFLKDIDKSKKTVIACRSDAEVHLIEKALTSLKYVVYACDSTMTIQELYNIDFALSNYEEPISGPILVCCDANLTHLNITDAHYLIHFSLPELFSLFCKRFAVLIDNYSSIFDNQDTGVKIKIFLENDNIEQFPKILHFIQRCSDSIPPVLDDISSSVMKEKDLKKAKAFVPLCNTLLKLGNCPDVWNCRHRHAIFQDFDVPLPWMPREGVITFKILHYHSAVQYSVRLLSCITNAGPKKYPQTYSMLSIKMGMYYSKEINRKLHGVAKPGDVCAVSLKQNLFVRCQVMKVLKNAPNNLPCVLLINLLDEEKFEMARDTCLYHLPEELKKIDSYVAKVVLANIAPQDRDITYSKLAEEQLKRITEGNDDIYMRGNITMVIGNCILVDTLEACQDLSSLDETVVKNNFRNELLDGHAVDNPGHIKALEKLGENVEFIHKKDLQGHSLTVPKPIKVMPKARWAHLDSEGHSPVYYLYAKSPELFFVQHVKFQDCLNVLLKDIKKYVSENPKPVDYVTKGDIVLAEFPDDASFERARIDRVIDSSQVECFFVDLGDWSTVLIDKILPITEKLITQLPFQAIECRLVGIKPMGETWSEFSTNWLVDRFYTTDANLKYLFAKRFTKDEAEFTDGGKFGIGLIDTYADDNDVYINKLMVDANLAEENEEYELLNSITLEKELKESSDSESVDKVNLAGDKNIKNHLNISESNAAHDGKKDLTSNSALNTISLGNRANGSGNIDSNSYFTTKTDLPNLNQNLVDSNGKAEHNTDNKLAVIKKIGTHKRELGRNSSNSSSVSDSKDVIPVSQQRIMSWLGSHPIKSVPLVDSDDIDDDRWDTVNPVQLLVDPDGVDPDGVNPDIGPPKRMTTAIDYNTQPDKVDDSDNIQLSLSENKGKVVQDTIAHKVDKNLDSSKKQSEIDDKWSVSESDQIITFNVKNTENKINALWYQDSNSVTIILNMATEKYDLIISERSMKFNSKFKDIEFGFNIEFYDIVDTVNSTHSNKGTCIKIKLSKVVTETWLTLTKGSTELVDKTYENSSVKEANIENAITSVVSLDKGVLSTPIPNIGEADKLRKPRVVWRQNKTKVTIQILLITEEYDLIIKEKHIQFSANTNDEEYGFEFELYGVVDETLSSHSNKGQYIQVNLQKIMPKNWLVLAKGYIRKWIVYDVDNIDVSSEEEEAVEDKAVLENLRLYDETDSDDFDDDTNFGYTKQY